jgi:hypothetical protein
MDKHMPLIADAERIRSEDGAHIATVWTQYPSDQRLPGESWLGMRERTEEARILASKQTLERARQFAASPELLEVLDAINESVESLHATVGMIAARSEFEEDVHFHEKWAMDELLSKVERARAALSKARGEQV